MTAAFAAIVHSKKKMIRDVVTTVTLCKQCRCRNSRENGSVYKLR